MILPDLLKLYLYGYINQIRSSRRLSGKPCRNLELIWLIEEICGLGTGRSRTSARRTGRR